MAIKLLLVFGLLALSACGPDAQTQRIAELYTIQNRRCYAGDAGACADIRGALMLMAVQRMTPPEAAIAPMNFPMPTRTNCWTSGSNVSCNSY